MLTGAELLTDFWATQRRENEEHEAIYQAAKKKGTIPPLQMTDRRPKPKKAKKTYTLQEGPGGPIVNVKAFVDVRTGGTTILTDR